MNPLEVPIEITAEEARRRALEELAKTKYAGPPPWLIDRLQQLIEWLDRLIQIVLSPGSGNRGGFSWPMVVVILAVLVLVALVVWKVGLPRWQARRKDATVGTDAAEPPQTYRTAAERAAAAGDWAGAVRERFRATVRGLEELTVLDVRPARTAWEVARIAGRQVPLARTALDGSAAVFNDVEYGDAVATEAAYRQMTGWEDEIIAAAGRADLAAEPDGTDELVRT